MGGSPKLRLVVIGDSTSFTDDRGPRLPGDPATYPSVVARELETALEEPFETIVIARAGTHVRDAWRTLTKDRHVQFDVLPGADAVVVAVGSFDHAPAGIPPVLEAVVPYLRPPRVRRFARIAMRAVHPYGVRLSRGRFRRTPVGQFARTFDGVLMQVRSLARGAAGVVLGPTANVSAYYAGLNPHREAGERRQFAIAEGHGFATVACWPFVEPHRDRLNPDGIHWPADVHAAVGRALAGELVAQLRGERPRPPTPHL